MFELLYVVCYTSENLSRHRAFREGFVFAVKNGNNEQDGCGRRGNRVDHDDLFEDLISGDETRRRYAVRELSRQKCSREVDDFVRGLPPFKWEAKLSAVKIFAKIGDQTGIERLKALMLDYNPKVRQNARRSLYKLGVKQPYTDDDVVELVSYLDHPSWWVKTNAIKGLAALRDRRAVDPISQLLFDDDEAVREAAKEALAALRKKRDANK